MFDALSRQLSDVVRSISGKNRISEKNVQDAIEQIKVALLDADVHLKVVRRFVSRTLRDATGEAVLRSVSPGQQFTKIVHEKLVGFLGDERSELTLKGPDVVSVILLAGLQGSGKTTTAAKLAARLSSEGRRPLLVAADLVRPAAIDQLEQLGRQIGVEVEVQRGEARVENVVRSALKRAKREQFNTVIIDTAGRLQIDEPMMDELRRIQAEVNPHEILFVADAMTGQDAVNSAREFAAALP
ncbi:MAG: signal recognition particle receptor subunit alpha, partial [Opitutales bacterium]|nr:signal recognition particle receptor subunit alpha [Opitutales bacterium]